MRGLVGNLGGCIGSGRIKSINKCAHFSDSWKMAIQMEMLRHLQSSLRIRVCRCKVTIFNVSQNDGMRGVSGIQDSTSEFFINIGLESRRNSADKFSNHDKAALKERPTGHCFHNFRRWDEILQNEIGCTTLHMYPWQRRNKDKTPTCANKCYGTCKSMLTLTNDYVLWRQKSTCRSKLG